MCMAYMDVGLGVAESGRNIDVSQEFPLSPNKNTRKWPIWNNPNETKNQLLSHPANITTGLKPQCGTLYHSETLQRMEPQ